MLRQGRLSALGLACFLCGCGVAMAEPAHYVVFEVAPGDPAPRPVFYTQVELAHDAARDATPRDAKSALAYRSVLREQSGPLRYAEQPMLRAEFAPAPGDRLSELESFPVANGKRAFVIRIPLAQADALEFESGTNAKTRTRIDLGRLARNAQGLPLAATPTAKRLSTLPGNAGPAGNRVDILVLGDGYTSAESGLFATHAAQLFEAMFAMSPHTDYANLVNWRTGFIASAQSGADHPRYRAGCGSENLTCCGDESALGDPRAGQYRNTALDARYCTANIHRLLTVDHAKALAAAAAFPDWDRIFISVNDPVYGGSGGYMAVTSADAAAPQIAVHEFGHSFTQLADEYESPFPGFPDCSDLGIGTPCEANVSNQTSAAELKWSPLLTPGLAIPTTAATPGTGLFEGARYRFSGMYRPTHSMCLMRSNTDAFCPVCAAEFVRRLYLGGFGTPALGIDLIEPGSESPANAATVIVAPGSTRLFSAQVLVPTHGAVSQRWLLDGVEIPGANAASYTFSQSASGPSIRTLELRVHDETSLLPASMAGTLLDHSRIWTIASQATTSFAINQAITGAWSSPATSGQGMLIDLAPDPKVMFIAWFTYEKSPAPGAQAKVGSQDNRWLTASGPWSDDAAQLTLYASSGGVFDTGTSVTTAPIGTLSLRFHNCTHATAIYSIPDEGLAGTIELSRSATLGMGVLCQSLGTAAATGDTRR